MNPHTIITNMTMMIHPHAKMVKISRILYPSLTMIRVSGTGKTPGIVETSNLMTVP